MWVLNMIFWLNVISDWTWLHDPYSFRVLAEHEVWKGPRMNMTLDWKGKILIHFQRPMTKEDTWKSFLTEKDLLTKSLSVKDLWNKTWPKTFQKSSQTKCFWKRSLTEQDNGKGFLTEKYIGEDQPLVGKDLFTRSLTEKDPWKKCLW